MNYLKREKQELVLTLLVEGSSIRSIVRITGVNKNTIIKLLKKTGDRCQEILNKTMQELNCKTIECDEIWTFVAKKQKRLKPDDDKSELGDQYIFVAMDRDTKLVPTFIVGKRDGITALNFMEQLGNRVKSRFQLTTDRFNGYFNAVDTVFGGDIDYATIKKIYHGNGDGTREGYSPSDLKGIDIIRIFGEPDRKKICTSYIERQNLTIRMQMRRFTRLTNAFSKKLENLKAAVALHFYHYNFMRIHQTIRVTPAMEAGIAKTIWGWEKVLN